LTKKTLTYLIPGIAEHVFMFSHFWKVFVEGAPLERKNWCMSATKFLDFSLSTAVTLYLQQASCRSQHKEMLLMARFPRCLQLQNS